MKASARFYRRNADLVPIDSVRLEYNREGVGNGGVRVQFNSLGEKQTIFMSVGEARQLATQLLVATQAQNEGNVTIIDLNDGSAATLKG